MTSLMIPPGSAVERKRKRVKEDIVDQQRAVRSEEELLPRIRDDITLQVICGKLPWHTFRNLWFVSPAWHRVIQSGEVFASRAASHLAEPFAVINHAVSRGKFGLSLYSLGGSPKCRETLPPIPRMKTGIPHSCECVIWDGKVYIMGGLKDPITQLASANVYMLNLQGGRRNWRKCASMHSPRKNFRAGIMNGKFYVCGGTSRRAPVSGTEVYDPEADAWTALMPMPFPRTGHDAEFVDGELFVYGGKFFNDDFRASQANFRRAMPRALQAIVDLPDIPEQNYTYRANHVDVYNPVLNTWKRLLLDVPALSLTKPDERSSDHLLFMAHGSLHSMSDNEILVFDFERVSWTSLCSMSKIESGPYTPRISRSVRAIQMVENYLLVTRAPWYNNYFICLDMLVGLRPGLHEHRKPLSWIVIDENVCFEGVVSPFIRILHL